MKYLAFAKRVTQLEGKKLQTVQDIKSWDRFLRAQYALLSSGVTDAQVSDTCLVVYYT